MWGPPGGRRYQTLGKLDAKSEVEPSDEGMEVDEGDDDEEEDQDSNEDDGCKTSDEEQVLATNN